MIDLKNKVVVITGASSGIGKATAFEFARKGANLVLAARRLEKLEEISGKLQEFVKVMIVQTDVSKEKDVINLFNAAKKKFGRIDILINNAGRGLKSNICDISYDSWKAVIDTNLTGVFLCTREAAKRMKERRFGHIITISSMAGVYGGPTYAAYCASKSGVTRFKQSARWELRKEGIKVSTIHPARVDTEFFNDYKAKPTKGQMLPAKYLAEYIVAIAERRFFKRYLIKIRNFLKRIINLILM